MMEAATMPTVCLRFRFEEHPKIRALMEACADIQRQAVDYALENGKTATFTLIQALYPSLRAQHPDLHANLIYGAIRSGARIVHGFRNQQRRGKTRADRPEIRRPSVYLVRQTVKIEWDGRDPDRHDPGLPPGSGAHRPHLPPSPQVSPAAGRVEGGAGADGGADAHGPFPLHPPQVPRSHPL
jgi:hypothetical protein